MSFKIISYQLGLLWTNLVTLIYFPLIEFEAEFKVI